jgi:hypothetical protein
MSVRDDTTLKTDPVQEDHKLRPCLSLQRAVAGISAWMSVVAIVVVDVRNSALECVLYAVCERRTPPTWRDAHHGPSDPTTVIDCGLQLVVPSARRLLKWPPKLKLKYRALTIAVPVVQAHIYASNEPLDAGSLQRAS